MKDKVIRVKIFHLRCPNCHQNMESYTEIAFVEDFHVVVKGLCCGYEITSNAINILELLPATDKQVN